MTNTTDEPFTFSSNAMGRLRDYHQALVHYAAGQLESLRKNYTGVNRQMQLYAGYVAQWFQDERKSGGDQITFVRNYYGERLGRTRDSDTTVSQTVGGFGGGFA